MSVPRNEKLSSSINLFKKASAGISPHLVEREPFEGSNNPSLGSHRPWINQLPLATGPSELRDVKAGPRMFFSMTTLGQPKQPTTRTFLNY